MNANYGSDPHGLVYGYLFEHGTARRPITLDETLEWLARAHRPRRRLRIARASDGRPVDGAPAARPWAHDAEAAASQIFPVAPLDDTNFAFTESGWTASLATSDPFGGSWSGGGVDLSLTAAGSALALGDTATLTFDTQSPATAYNVFFQLGNGEWGVQAFGGDSNAFGDQIDRVNAVPEPATLLLFSIGGAGLALRLRRRRIA